ncbi:Hypothetical protein SRAE_X000007300 [Strongyloides ratti]|uniref:Uncharacterized protein n=1 Tax=Strongyloides ratti TaxID=34506 RepID=A0A090LRG9_STRRB|nr:Hypothetical protein SRAE_X000007300 [Strongyloides ratti]CEF70742.1 Hypothetical protein SRAE_X000007300 [Strongyloides ratti]
MVYHSQKSQNDSNIIQYQKNPVILLPKMSNTVTGSSINSIMKAVNTDNIPTESYILMPISIVTNNYPSSSYHIPRPIANISKSNSLSLSTVNLNPLNNSIPISSIISNNKIINPNTRYQVQQKRNMKKGRSSRNTIGVTRGTDIFKDQNLLPILSSASMCTENSQPNESKLFQSISLNTVKKNNSEIDYNQTYASQDNENHCKTSPSEDNSVIYDVPNFNLPPSLPPHSSTKISQNSTFDNSRTIQSKFLQKSYNIPNNINGYHSNILPIIGTKYFIPPPPPPINHSIVMKESKRQFKEILKNDRKLKKYQKKLQRGFVMRICCSSVTQLIWGIISIICLGFLAYIIFVYYLI